MKIQIFVDDRIVSTHASHDLRKPPLDESKRHALKEAMDKRQLRISEALRARFTVSDDEPSNAQSAPYSNRAAAALIPSGDRKGSEG